MILSNNQLNALANRVFQSTAQKNLRHQWSEIQWASKYRTRQRPDPRRQ